MSGFINAHLQLDNWLWLLRAATLIVAMLVLSLTFRHWRRSQERDAQRMFEQLDLLRNELLMMQERMEHVPATPLHQAVPEPLPVVNVERSMPLPANMSVTPAPRGYEVAARLARSGATVDELVSSCGLSRHEAQLVLRLHGPQARPADKPVAAPPVQKAATVNAELQRSEKRSTAPASRTAARVEPRFNERDLNDRLPERHNQPRMAPTRTSRFAAAV